jgi:hypothetical protein
VAHARGSGLINGCSHTTLFKVFYKKKQWRPPSKKEERRKKPKTAFSNPSYGDYLNA